MHFTTGLSANILMVKKQSNMGRSWKRVKSKHLKVQHCITWSCGICEKSDFSFLTVSYQFGILIHIKSQMLLFVSHSFAAMAFQPGPMFRQVPHLSQLQHFWPLTISFTIDYFFLHFLPHLEYTLNAPIFTPLLPHVSMRHVRRFFWHFYISLCPCGISLLATSSLKLVCCSTMVLATLTSQDHPFPLWSQC